MSKKEVRKAQKVRFYQELIGWPATRYMTQILENGMRNADVGGSNVENAEGLGEPAALPKGKMTCKHPITHKTRHSKKSDLRFKGKVVDLYADIMHTGKCLFLVTKAGNGHHHQIRAVIGDAILHLYAKDEHVQNVERELQMIKEQLQ
eukprot:660928-Ditylum_brightwellii.AAC.1